MAEEISDANFEQIVAQLEREEQQQKSGKPSEPVSKSKHGEYTFPHREIMEQEGLKNKDLPDDLKKMVMSFDGKLSMAKARNANEGTFLEIQKLSTIISDKLMDYLEKDIMAKKEVKKEEGVEATPAATPAAAENAEAATEATPNAEDKSAISNGIEDGEQETPKAESKGIFGGILGGILDW